MKAPIGFGVFFFADETGRLLVDNRRYVDKEKPLLWIM
jgi:hypothetical protein